MLRARKKREVQKDSGEAYETYRGEVKPAKEFFKPLKEEDLLKMIPCIPLEYHQFHKAPEAYRK